MAATTKTAPTAPPLSEARPWVEKYRPRTLNDVQSQQEVVAALRACLTAGSNMPNLLFHGPPGTGKTSAILAVARDLFGPDYYPTRVSELNASDDRGIQVVREKVKALAQGSVGQVAAHKIQSDGRTYPVPSFKLIVLDEADALLPDAQAALRRMMEDFSGVTRFAILCNYVSKIIDPIASRCAKFRFKPLMKELMYARLRMIAEQEGVTVSDTTLQRLDYVAGGDLRLAIVYLQSAGRAATVAGDLTNEDFVGVAGEVPEAALRSYLEALLSGNFDTMTTSTIEMTRCGYAASVLLKNIISLLVGRDCPLSTITRAALALKVAETEKRLLDRGDDLVQLLDLGTSFVNAIAKQPVEVS